MPTKTKSNLGRRIREITSEPKSVAIATGHLRKIMENITKSADPEIGDIPEADFDDVERMLAAILSSLRSKRFSECNLNFSPRPIKKQERSKLDNACKELELNGSWKDHVSAADTNRGTVIVAEPYGLDREDFEDFLKLINGGWKVWVDDRWATYFPGHAVCVFLLPPQQKKP